jgi:hypothetical protein
MALSVNPSTLVITIPQADLTWVSGTIYSLDTDAFRLELKAWEYSAEGIVQLVTHTHNTEVTVAGTTFARTIEILPPYSITFEDGQYTVILEGSNNNIFDVANSILNQNQVQIIPTNSAGLIVVTSGSGLSTEEHDHLLGLDTNNLDVLVSTRLATTGYTAPDNQGITDIETKIDVIDTLIDELIKLTGNKVTKSGDVITIYESDGLTPWRQYNLASGGRVQV